MFYIFTAVESSLQVIRCKEIVHQLPEQNYAVLKFLLSFLHMVSKNQVITVIAVCRLNVLSGLKQATGLLGTALKIWYNIEARSWR